MRECVFGKLQCVSTIRCQIVTKCMADVLLCSTCSFTLTLPTYSLRHRLSHTQYLTASEVSLLLIHLGCLPKYSLCAGKPCVIFIKFYFLWALYCRRRVPDSTFVYKKVGWQSRQMTGFYFEDYSPAFSPSAKYFGTLVGTLPESWSLMSTLLQTIIVWHHFLGLFDMWTISVKTEYRSGSMKLNENGVLTLLNEFLILMLCI